MSESQKQKEEKFDVDGFEKLKAAFNEYEAEQKERFKNFSVGPLKVVRLRAYSMKNGQKGTIANDISGEAQSVATSTF